MEELTIQMDKVIAPPDKVLLMYEAVSRFVQKKQPLTSLKVSDITKEAGIGKGTAYEYFASKEELIAHALLFECARKMQEAEDYIFAVEGFTARLDRALDWIYENRVYNELVSEMVRLAIAEGKCMASQGMPGYAKTYLKSLLSHLMGDGLAEGIITEADPQKQMLSATSMVFGYLVFVSGDKNEVLLSTEETKAFLIKSMVRSLN